MLSKINHLKYFIDLKINLTHYFIGNIFKNDFISFFFSVKLNITL
jgi:hypothetical protein